MVKVDDDSEDDYNPPSGDDPMSDVSIKDLAFTDEEDALPSGEEDEEDNPRGKTKSTPVRSTNRLSQFQAGSKASPSCLTLQPRPVSLLSRAFQVARVRVFLVVPKTSLFKKKTKSVTLG